MIDRFTKYIHKSVHQFAEVLYVQKLSHWRLALMFVMFKVVLEVCDA